MPVEACFDVSLALQVVSTLTAVTALVVLIFYAYDTGRTALAAIEQAEATQMPCVRVVPQGINNPVGVTRCAPYSTKPPDFHGPEGQ